MRDDDPRRKEAASYSDLCALLQEAEHRLSSSGIDTITKACDLLLEEKAELQQQLAETNAKLDDSEQIFSQACTRIAEQDSEIVAALEQRNQHLKREQALEQQLAEARKALQAVRLAKNLTEAVMIANAIAIDAALEASDETKS